MSVRLVPSSLSSLTRRCRQRLVAEICRRACRDRGDRWLPSAMLAGTARSGTTWVAELIDSQVPCRILFEPFNPDKVPEYADFEYFQYMPPDVEHPALLSYCRRLVSGQLRGRWIDGHAAHVFPRLRLIKDIRATLMLRWFHARFPDVPILYLLRHPCAVVLSRMRLGWATDLDVQRFLRQSRLVSDHLLPYLDVIGRASTDEEKHAVVWCISNLVPLRQFQEGGWTLVRYEQLLESPETEIPRVANALGLEFREDIFSRMRRPSRTTRHASRSVRGRRAPATWTQHLAPRQIDRVLAVVSAFGLAHLYGAGVDDGQACPANLPAMP